VQTLDRFRSDAPGLEQIRERVGETRYFEELGLAGVNTPAEFRSANKALECYARPVQIAALPEVAA
jgi:hypothetical protein